MTEIFNRLPQKDLRKILRHNMPKAEVVLWSRIKGRQVNGRKFRRQYSIGKYVVDFYCPECELIIEIDGDSHYSGVETKNYDSTRQECIESLGLKFLRFTNLEIYNNLQTVLDVIYEFTRPPLAPPS